MYVRDDEGEIHTSSFHASNFTDMTDMGTKALWRTLDYD